MMVVDDGFVEIGAQWIHGEENNVVYEMASPRNLLSSSVVSNNVMFVRSSSEILHESISDTLFTGVEKIQTKDGVDFSGQCQSSGHFFIKE